MWLGGLEKGTTCDSVINNFKVFHPNDDILDFDLKSNSYNIF